MYTADLMCSQGAPKSHRGIDFHHHNDLQVIPEGSNLRALAAKRNPKGPILKILGAQRVLQRAILIPKGHRFATKLVSLGLQA